MPSYDAVRSDDALLIRNRLYKDEATADRYAWEFYTGLSQPGAFEETNTYDAGNPIVQDMTEAIRQFQDCDSQQCRDATQ